MQQAWVRVPSAAWKALQIGICVLLGLSPCKPGAVARAGAGRLVAGALARTSRDRGRPPARGWIVESVGGTLGEMHPIGVASAAWVFASAPSKVPFYVAGGSLAGWAVLLGVTGLTHPDFPDSAGLARLVMLTSVLLVAATITTAVVTAGEEGAGEGTTRSGAAAQPSTLALAADPTGKLSYDKKQATAKAGRLAIRFTNRSSLPHNVTIAKGATVVARTKTIERAATIANANLPGGDYVFYCSVDAHRQAGMHGTLTVNRR
jgi:plastocyanin